MINFIVDHWDEILLAITSIVTAASIIVKLTPSEKDDKVVSRIIKFLNTIAINPKGKK
jgi:hypothetical protein